MSSLSYLWHQRKKYRFGSKKWSKAWAKRLWTGPALILMSVRVWLCVLEGCRIGQLTTMSRCQFVGKKRFLAIGNGSAIGRVRFVLHAPVTIGERAVINDSTQILTATHDVMDPNWGTLTASIEIEDYAWIAEGAVLMPGVVVGRGAVVGAHAVVTKNVAAYTVVVGNPARVVDRRRVENLNYIPSYGVACYQAWLG